MKRVIDLTIIILSLPLIIFLCLLIAILVKINLGSPIFFQQLRPGLNGKNFIMFKFRTMTNGSYTSGNLLPDEFRLNAFGKFLRSTSMDELPEIWNVIKGNMSLVGPRPLLIEYIPLYNKREARRHEVLPGITGWAQVNGRNAVSWEKSFDMDIWYIDNYSIWLDIKILWLTIKKVILRSDISQNINVTRNKFKGRL
tara:strand:+ start:242 stop:832 length:591 start_codon:yes stop_codon:yes gene_type:complete